MLWWLHTKLWDLRFGEYPVIYKQNPYSTLLEREAAL